jgi:hypothetical protein
MKGRFDWLNGADCANIGLPMKSYGAHGTFLLDNDYAALNCSVPIGKRRAKQL